MSTGETMSAIVPEKILAIKRVPGVYRIDFYTGLYVHVYVNAHGEVQQMNYEATLRDGGWLDDAFEVRGPLNHDTPPTP